MFFAKLTHKLEELKFYSEKLVLYLTNKPTSLGRTGLYGVKPPSQVAHGAIRVSGFGKL